jgi:5-phospho-D-xylono-1,4-lactonase
MRRTCKNAIQTVSGSISIELLGYCQCHEHVFIAKGKSFELYPSLWMDDLSASTEELMLYKAAGGCSVVDAQPVGCGRMAEHLSKASMDSGVNIIASTGFHKLIFYDSEHWIYKLNEDDLSQIFINELESGMYIDADKRLPSVSISTKAGIIKTAVDSFGIKEDYIRLFNAAANASLETGAPLMCHIEKGADAFEVFEFFTKRKIMPGSLVFCHLDRVEYDIGYHRELAETGVYLEYDTIARFKYHSNEMEIRLILEMINSGFEDRILLGFDTTRERLKSYGSCIGLDYIKNSFIPLMQQSCIPGSAIDKMTIENPKKALAWKC